MPTSKQLFKQAKHYIPGGVNSPVRAYQAVGGTPPFIQSAKGAHVVDVDGRNYIDYVGSWGPMVLGHAHGAVVHAVQQACSRGLSFGAPTEAEIELASLLCECVPSLQQVRLVNSGTEAAMSAIRLARGFSGRHKIIKFEGNYHGHADALLVGAGSGAMSHQQPTSAGLTPGCIEDTLVAHYNDLNSVIRYFEQYPKQIAAVLVEPMAGNMNFVPPIPGFLEGLRQCCDQHGSLLIFDEVMTGFRVALGGAQSLYGITPDLSILGKIIGGGLPIGAFGGRKDIMAALSPLGPVYQAGTLSGNPIAVAAGIATIKQLQQAHVYPSLSEKNRQLQQQLQHIANHHRIPFCSQYAGGMFGWFFTQEAHIQSLAQVKACDAQRFSAFFQCMLQQGIYLAPSPYEAGFISLAHDQQDITRTCEAFDHAMTQLARHGAKADA